VRTSIVRAAQARRASAQRSKCCQLVCSSRRGGKSTGCSMACCARSRSPATRSEAKPGIPTVPKTSPQRTCPGLVGVCPRQVPLSFRHCFRFGQSALRARPRREAHPSERGKSLCFSSSASATVRVGMRAHLVHQAKRISDCLSYCRGQSSAFLPKIPLLFFDFPLSQR